MGQYIFTYRGKEIREKASSPEASPKRHRKEVVKKRKASISAKPRKAFEKMV